MSLSSSPFGCHSQLLKKQTYLPRRDPGGDLLMAVDHCFSIRGQGTVMTGTILQGSLAINDTVEIPALKVCSQNGHEFWISDTVFTSKWHTRVLEILLQKPQSFRKFRSWLKVDRQREGWPSGFRGCVGLMWGKDEETGGGLTAQELGNLDQMHTFSQGQQFCLQVSCSPLGGSKWLNYHLWQSLDLCHCCWFGRFMLTHNKNNHRDIVVCQIPQS